MEDGYAGFALSGVRGPVYQREAVPAAPTADRFRREGAAVGDGCVLPAPRLADGGAGPSHVRQGVRQDPVPQRDHLEL